MTASRAFGIPTPLLLAVGLLGLLAVHTIAYLAAHGPGDHYDAAMRTGGHDGYWPVLVVAAFALATAAFVAARQRAGFSRSAPTTLRARAAVLVRAWTTLALVSVTGFVALENLEALVVSRRVAGLEPLDSLAGPAGVGTVVLAISALTLGAFATVAAGRREYRTVLTRSYADLVASGVFTASFRQSPWAVAFVGEVVGDLIDRVDTRDPVRVLECGCGTGIWIEELASLGRARGRALALAGFDLSPEMVEAARSRLGALGVAAQVRQGDALLASSYRFDGDDTHDLVLAYDVVQQLPRDGQQAAVDELLAHVRPGGHLVVFDHDRDSRYGRTMGTKKWLRRYLGIPIVPRYYTLAAYPPLERMRRRLVARGLDARIVVEAGARKRALVVRAVPDAAPR